MSHIPPTIRNFASVASATLDITGLDLNTDLMYEILFKSTKLSVASNISFNFNNDVNPTYSNAATGIDYSGTAANFFNAGITGIPLITGAGFQYKSISGRILLMLQDDGRPGATFQVIGMDDGTSSHFLSVVGAGMKDWTTNVTSLKFTATGTGDWTARVKPVKFF